MSRTENQETQFENLLDAITDALLHDQDDVNKIVARYPVPATRLDGLVDLITRLNIALTPQQPRDRFVHQLKRDLVGQQSGLLARLRYLPGRVQIAAGLAVIAGGLMLVSRRRGFDIQDAIQDAEIPLLQQR
jgi:hypothetical protein